MIFVNHARNAAQAKDYFVRHLAPGDYYTKDCAEMKGVWHGRGAEMLGLAGEVKADDFMRLCDNEHPVTGERLTARTRDDRRVLTDFTFDCPKSVTLAYELGGGEAVFDCFRDSVRETMTDIECDAQTRVRKNGADTNRTTSNVIWTEHFHRTTRPVEGIVDCQLHCHATIFNATYCDVEKKWKAIQLGDIVRDKGFYQAAFHGRLASKLATLGYGIEKDGNSFRLAGIDRETVDKFSRRTALIEAEAVRLGIDDVASKSQLGRRTREAKSKQPATMSELRTEWNARLTDDERSALARAASGAVKGDDRISPFAAKAYALEHSFSNASAVSERRLMAEALTYGVGSVLPRDVADIARHPDAIPVKHGGQRMVTTKPVLMSEIAMLQFALDGQRKCRPFVNPAEGQGTDLNGLSAEQTKAAMHILLSRDRVTGVVGRAGTGKTRMMMSTIAALEKASGQKAFVFAPSAQASRGVLKKEGFENAETLEALLRNEKLQRQVKGQVIWVDEAGLVSTRDMQRLMAVAQKEGSRVILSGDYTQHSSVEHGDAFRLLEKEAGVRLARLTEIRRQTEAGYKKAVEAISQGSGKAAQKGFDALNKMGCVIEASGEERHQMLVADYLEGQSAGKSGLIIAPTHREGEKLTEALRDALKERGVLGTERNFKSWRGTSWTDAQKRDLRNYEPGMAVEFQQNAKGFTRSERAVVIAGEHGPMLLKQNGHTSSLPVDKPDRFEVYRVRDIGVSRGERIRITRNALVKAEGQAKTARINNGDIFTVQGFTNKGEIRIDNGKLLPKDFAHLAMGYVDTSYASQGKTIDRVYIATGSESLAAANQQQWYVSVTRGREMAKVYVDSKDEVRDAIARAGERLSAVELTGTSLRTTWRERFAETIERNRVAKFLKDRAASLVQKWREKGREGVGYA